jgi:hypothetical protein
MLILISPAKLLDFKTQVPTDKMSNPLFVKQANQLIEKLRTYTPEEIQDMMHISPELAQLNYLRFKSWKNTPKPEQTKQAIFAFSGELFRGIQAIKMTDEDIDFAQNHLRILSGLYGILRPLDRIQPYRLEMGIKLEFKAHKNLYSYWGNTITDEINKKNKASDYIINLASNEYFKSIKKQKLNGTVITPVFKDFNKGKLKVVTVYAKNARGQMARYIIRNRISHPDEIKLFDVNGYEFNPNTSTDTTWEFIR